MIEKREVVICDACRSEFDPELSTSAVELIDAEEGNTVLESMVDGKSVVLSEGHFCSLDCFFRYIKDSM